MTAFGSEEVAVRTLRAGAANYIPKKDLARDLPATLRRVLNVASLNRERGRILRCLVRRESAFLLDSDPNLIMALMPSSRRSSTAWIFATRPAGSRSASRCKRR